MKRQETHFLLLTECQSINVKKMLQTFCSSNLTRWKPTVFSRERKCEREGEGERERESGRSLTCCRQDTFQRGTGRKRRAITAQLRVC